MRDVDRLGYGLRLLFTTLPLAQIGMPARQLGYLSAFQTLRPHRGVALESMSVTDVAQEPIFYNSHIVQQGGAPLVGSVALALAQHGVACVGALAAPLPTTLPADLRAAAEFAQASLPLAWLGIMQGASHDAVRSEWYTHPTMPTMAFRVQHSAPGLLVHAFSVGISFALTPLDSVPRMHSSQLVPAHVLDWDPRRAYRSPPVDIDAQAPQLTHYLTQHLGSCFSPQLWSIGDRSLPAFVVKEACERRVQLRCIASDSSFVPSQPLRPAIWEDDWAADGVPALGIRAREARWVQGVGRAQALVRNTRDWEPEPAAWQRQSRPRPLPPRRVFDASVAAAPARLAVDALQDPLGSDSSTSAPPWSPVWRRLLGIELDRQHRALARRILHGSVLCGAFRTYVGRGTAEQAPCPHAACMGSFFFFFFFFLG